MEQLDIYVLGAGASYVHGAPLTNEILHYALTQVESGNDARLNLLREFLKNSFHFDTTNPKFKPGDYPSLVDVLSVVDMAIDRKESLANIYNEDQLRKIRESLEYAIFVALEDSLAYDRVKDKRRSTATWQLVKRLNPVNTAIISFNYDVIIDIALSRRFRDTTKPERFNSRSLLETDRLGIDYGVEFANMAVIPPQEPLFRLWKLHGSFNWLFSPVTGRLYYGGLSKAIAIIYDEQSERALDIDSVYRNPFAEKTRVLEPIMITPTQLKDLRNVHLMLLWRKAEEAIRHARSITFIGYSLPGDDLHIKYLFKRAIETRSLMNEPKITVVDYAEGMEPTLVQQRYQQFFGGDVEYFRRGFEEYVNEKK